MSASSSPEPARRLDSSDDEEGPGENGRARLDSSDEEDGVEEGGGVRGGGEAKGEAGGGDGDVVQKERKKDKKKKKDKKAKKEKKKKKKKKKSKRKLEEDEEPRKRSKRKRRKDSPQWSEAAYARFEQYLTDIEENPRPDFIAQKMASDTEFAAYVASNGELAEALAEKVNAFEELKRQEEQKAEEEEVEEEKEDEIIIPVQKVDLEKSKMDGCDNHPDEVKRAKSFRPLADGKKAKALHSAAMTLEEWTKKKAELAKAERERFLAQGNVIGRVKCRHCKGPHWTAACPSLKKHIRKEDTIGGGGGYKKPFWECLKCGHENSNKRKHDCSKCGALWRSGWAKSGQAW